MDIPKPHPPKTVLKPIVEAPKESTQPLKKPFVLRPHLTDRPFSNLKAALEQSN